MHQKTGAIELLLREQHLRLLLGHIRFPSSTARRGPLDLRFRLFQRGVNIVRVHAGDHLDGFDNVAFVGEDFGDAPRKLGVDVDPVRLEPAIAEDDGGRQWRVETLPPVKSAPPPAPTKTATTTAMRSHQFFFRTFLGTCNAVDCGTGKPPTW